MVKKLEGKHVLFILLGFFGYMLIANMTFLYVALDSFSGLATKDAYVKGLNYNAQIEEFEAQQSRGWHVQLNEKLTGDKTATLSLNARDDKGAPIAFENIRVVIKRPALSELDFEVQMQPVADQYGVDVTFPAAGNWDVEIYASGGGYEKPYRLEKRLWVK